MRPAHVLLLDAKVKEQKTDIKMNRRPLTKLAIEMAAALGFRVSASALRAVLHANDIETKVRSRTTLQIEALREENAAIKELLSEIVHAPKISDTMMKRARALIAPIGLAPKAAATG